MSELRSETARTNGAKSLGPVTEQGKAISARNSLRHGLRAKQVVLSTESQEDFDELLEAYVQRFHPADAVEADLVESMAAARWRLRRIAAIETSLLEQGIEGAVTHKITDQPLAFAFSSKDGSFSALARYENTLNRTYDRALKQLQLLQKSRPTSEPGFVRQVSKPAPPASVEATLPPALHTPPPPQLPPDTNPAGPAPPEIP